MLFGIHGKNTNPITGTQTELVAYLVLNVFSAHVLLPLLLVSLCLPKHVNRHPTLINLCFLWMIFGLSRCILLYTGTQSGPEPPIEICLVQASLIYAENPTTSLLAFILMYQVYSTVRGKTNAHGDETWQNIRYYFLLISPYAVIFFFVVAGFMLGVAKPMLVSRAHFFRCGIAHVPLISISIAFTVIFLFSALVLEARTLWLIRNKKKESLKIGYSSNIIGTYSLFVFLAFATISFISIIFSIISGVAGLLPQSPDWIFTIIPYCIFIVFSRPMWYNLVDAVTLKFNLKQGSAWPDDGLESGDREFI